MSTYESPYLLAPKFSTLDHSTGGFYRLECGDLAAGQRRAQHHRRDRQIPHDERYAIAQEFLEVTYKLWEGS